QNLSLPGSVTNTNKVGGFSLWVANLVEGAYSPGVQRSSEFETNARGHLVCTMVDSTGTADEVFSNAEIPVGQWVHVGCVIDHDTNMMILYVDGIVAGSKPTTLGSVNASNGPIFIGNSMDAWYNGVIPRFVAGDLDDIGIWSRALGPQEINLM